MTHIDEGTIHAWLDGALDPAQAGDVEAHVRQCTQCAESVAEARGLIAGSSRILNALDDVPANVVPIGSKRATVVPSVAKRRWRAAPWVTSIAAVLLIAVVLRRPGDEAGMMAGDAAMPIAQSEAAPVSLGDTGTRRTEVAATPTVVPRESNARIAVSSGSPARQRAGVATGAGAAGVAGAVVSAAQAEQIGISSARTARVARDERAADMSAAAPAPAAPPSASAASGAPVPVASPLTDFRVLRAAEKAAASEFQGLEGCYRVNAATRAGVVAKVEGMAARSAQARSPSRAVAPLREESGFLIRLDTLRGSPGFLVRSSVGDSTVGWWRRVDGDSARADLLSIGVFTFSGSDRVNCPE